MLRIGLTLSSVDGHGCAKADGKLETLEGGALEVPLCAVVKADPGQHHYSVGGWSSENFDGEIVSVHLMHLHSGAIAKAVLEGQVSCDDHRRPHLALELEGREVTRRRFMDSLESSVMCVNTEGIAPRNGDGVNAGVGPHLSGHLLDDQLVQRIDVVVARAEDGIVGEILAL
jgi:hypothetical protein